MIISYKNGQMSKITEMNSSLLNNETRSLLYSPDVSIIKEDFELNHSDEVTFFKYKIFLEDICDAYHPYRPAFQKARKYWTIPEEEFEFKRGFNRLSHELHNAVWRLERDGKKEWKLFVAGCTDTLNCYNALRKFVTSYYVDTYKVEENIKLPRDGLYMPFSEVTMEKIRRYGQLLRKMRMYSVYCPNVSYIFKNGRTDDRRRYIDQYVRVMNTITLDFNEKKFSKELEKLDRLRL